MLDACVGDDEAVVSAEGRRWSAKAIWRVAFGPGSVAYPWAKWTTRSRGPSWSDESGNAGVEP